MEPLRQLYGRHLEDFEVGRTYSHPWEVTLEAGDTSLFASAFLNPMPTFASRPFAEALGFRARPLSPWLILNLSLSFSTHDLSEQCVEPAYYQGVRFPRPVYAGDTVRASSTCTDLTASADRSRGVVHFRTCLYNQTRQPVCWLERKLVVPGGSLDLRPFERYTEQPPVPESVQPLPPELGMLPPPPERDFGFAGHFEDFARGQVFLHQCGKTITEGEHQMLATLVRSTHRAHTDAYFAAWGGTSTGKRHVLDGLVFAWAASLSSRDLCGNAIWELGFEDGTHTGPVHAADTLYAASKVTAVQSVAEDYGALHTRLVLVKNVLPEKLLADGHDLFKPERTKPAAQRIEQKVFEVTRHVLVRRRP